MKKIFIAMPLSESTLKAKTAFSLVHAIKGLYEDIDINFALDIGCDLIGSRTRLVRQALHDKATHILFVDYDMFFPPEGGENPIERLLDYDKDIVGAAYNKRSLPLQSTATPLTENTPIDTLFKCQVIGTGFLLIKIGVFAKIPEPWFLYPGWRLRAMQLVDTPAPFKARNIFGGSGILDRV